MSHGGNSEPCFSLFLRFGGVVGFNDDGAGTEGACWCNILVVNSVEVSNGSCFINRFVRIFSHCRLLIVLERTA